MTNTRNDSKKNEISIIIITILSLFLFIDNLCIAGTNKYVTVKNQKKTTNQALKTNYNILEAEQITTELINDLKHIYNFINYDADIGNVRAFLNAEIVKNCSQIPPSIIEAAAKSDLDLKIAYTKSEDGKNLKNIAKSILNSYMNKSYYFAFSIDVGKYNLTSEKVVYDLLQYGWNGYQFPFSYREKKYKVNNFIRYTYIDADGIYLDNIKLDKWGYISTGRIEPETALLLKGKNDNVKDSYFVLLFSITAFDTAIYNWGGLPRRGSIIIGKLHKIGILSNVKISDIGEYRPQIIYEEQYK